MRRLETQPVECFNETRIDEPARFDVSLPDGRQLDYEALISNTPAVTSAYDGHHDPQLVISAEGDLALWDETTHFPVGRLDKIHGRTLEVLASKVQIEDRHGNEYASLCIKGSDLSDPHFFRTATAARGHIIRGLQESLVMERVIRASQVLRESGVSTEYICGLVMPESFPLDQDQSGIDDKTLKTLPEFLEHLAGRFSAETETDGLKALERKAEMIDRFKDCDYMVSYRAMDCPYRLSELSDKEKFQDFKEFVQQNIQPNELTELIKDQDVTEYITTVFSYNTARNIARMHKADLTHGFLTNLNVSGLGSIIDLDSCRGEPLGLGDEPITRKDEITDVIRCLAGIRETIYAANSEPNEASAALTRQAATRHAGYVFMRHYLAERFEKTEEKTEFLASVLENYKVHDELDKDGVFLFDLARDVSHVWHTLEKIEYPHDLPIYHEEISPQIKRHLTFLNHLPAELFQDLSKIDIQKSMLNQPHNEHADALHAIGQQGDIYHPMRFLIRNLCLEELVNKYTEGHIEKPEDLLFVASCMVNTLDVKDERQRAAVEHANQYIDRLVWAVTGRLGEDDEEAVITPALKPYINKLSDFKSRIGTIDLRRDGTNIIYIKNDAEYSQLLDALGINETTRVNEMPFYTIYQVGWNKEYLHTEMIVIADYETVEYTSAQTTKEHLLRTLMSQQSDLKPMLFIGGPSGSTPYILFHPGNKIPDDFAEENHTGKDLYGQLLASLMPSLHKAPQAQLLPDKLEPSPPQFSILDTSEV